MPDKYTSAWPALVEAFNTHGLAGLMAFVLGYLRIIYDGRESRPMRQFIEALLGGAGAGTYRGGGGAAGAAIRKNGFALTWGGTNGASTTYVKGAVV